MSSKRLPRFLLIAAATAAAITAIMLSVFFVQYRWLANELTETSAAEHNALLNESFERRARAQMHSVADNISALGPDQSRDTVAALLERRLASNPGLEALRYSGPIDGVVTVGSFPSGDYAERTTWLRDALVVRYDVELADRPDAEIEGVFALDELRYAATLFADSIAAEEARSRRTSYVWIATVSVLVLTASGLFVFAIHRSTSGRIEQLKQSYIMVSLA